MEEGEAEGDSPTPVIQVVRRMPGPYQPCSSMCAKSWLSEPESEGRAYVLLQVLCSPQPAADSSLAAHEASSDAYPAPAYERSVPAVTITQKTPYKPSSILSS
jgi:hypothetical protein